MLALTYFHETWQMIWPFICNLGFIKQVFIKYLFIILFDELIYDLYLILFPNLKNFVHAFFNLIYLLFQRHVKPTQRTICAHILYIH